MNLPTPPHHYIELEAARFWGYKIYEWYAESKLNRGRAMAHYIHHTLRSNYASEMSMKEKKPSDGYSNLMKSMGLQF